MEGYSPSPVPNSRRITVEEGNDYFLGPNDELPFKLLRNLGHGKSGFVSEVKDTWTGAVYACKTFPLDLPCDTHKRRRAFQNEMNILRRLAKHQHIVSVFATFSKECELSLLLLPVADQRDLSVFLRASLRDQTIDQRKISILRQAFGCLANGLAFIHRYRVRHKDIKPSNILVHRGSVLYTDFGFSLDSSKADQSTTTGRPEFWTRRYSAPEVLEYEDRNSGSDVFSLGCVYIEMLSVMNPQLRSAGKVCFGEEIEQVHTLMNASEAPTTFLADLAPLCISMTQRARSSRPNASQAFEIIQKLPGYVCSQCLPRESIKGETVPYTEKSTDMGATSRREELLNNTEHKKQHENFISSEKYLEETDASQANQNRESSENRQWEHTIHWKIL
jgi:serine/threonine protein kinase